MTIKQIRAYSGLTQEAFSKKYNIPVSTIKGWEAPEENQRHRDCPDYVVNMLERLVVIDYQKTK